jgi:hypothetical protein
VQFTISGYQKGKENEMKFKFYHPRLVQSHGSPYHELREVPVSFHVISFVAFLDQRENLRSKQKYLMKRSNKFKIFLTMCLLNS